MLYAIQEVSRLTGITSRTLRHYGAEKILEPTRTDASGRRFYDEAALVRLQRILVLRELGLGVPAIRHSLERGIDDAAALDEHLTSLHREHRRIGTLIESVTATLHQLQRGEPLMTEHMFAGFDHTAYEDEVRERWGDAAWEQSNRWWSALDPGDQQAFMNRHRDLQDAYDQALADAASYESARVQEIAAAHVAWITAAWRGREPDAATIKGLADMYVADPRFAQNYTRSDPSGAEFVRDALHYFVDHRHV